MTSVGGARPAEGRLAVARPADGPSGLGAGRLKLVTVRRPLGTGSRATEHR